MTALQAKREEFVTEIRAFGKEVREGVTNLIDSEVRIGNTTAIADLAQTQESLLLGRLYFEKFLLTNADTELTESRNRLDFAQQSASKVAGSLQGSARNEAIQIRDGISAYLAQAGKISDEMGTMVSALKTFREAGIQRLQLEKQLEEENENTKQLAQREREERENTEKMEQALKRAVDQLGDGLLRLADGDLTVQLDEPFIETID